MEESRHLTYEAQLVGQSLPSPISGDFDREKSWRVARYQRWVIYALIYSLLFNIVTSTVPFAARQADPLLVNVRVLPQSLVIAIFATLAIFLLASELHNAGIGVLCSVLMFVPCISLITLLIINGQATGYLRKHGVKVGFMGADPDNIRRRGSTTAATAANLPPSAARSL